MPDGISGKQLPVLSKRAASTSRTFADVSAEQFGNEFEGRSFFLFADGRMSQPFAKDELL